MYCFENVIDGKWTLRLLSGVSQYLRSKNWDTRVAAAHAVGAIAQNVVHATLDELFVCVETEMSAAGISGSGEDVIMSWTNSCPNIVAGLSFKSFDMSKVLEFGALLASGGQEYDVATDGSKTPGERLARQKQNLRRRLGLDVCEQFMDVNDMIKDEDLLVNKSSSHENGTNHRSYIFQHGNQIQQLVANMVPTYISKRPSARELNLLKRKAKINAKDQTKGWSDDAEFEAPPTQTSVLPKLTSADPMSSNKMFTDAVSDDAFDYDVDGQWPFQNFVEQLILDMFDPSWEVRHGSMMSLREIITQQGGSAGVFRPDLSLESVDLVETEERHNLRTLKREREIDLNVQVSGEDTESSRKKLKCKDVPCPVLNAMTSLDKEAHPVTCIKREDGSCDLISLAKEAYPGTCIKMEDGGCDLVPLDKKAYSGTSIKMEDGGSDLIPLDKEAYPSTSLKMEDGGCDLIPLQVGGLLKDDSAKVEPQTCLDDIDLHSEKVGDKLEKKNIVENASSIPKLEILNSVSGSCKLMKLLKLTRNSWMKNWEFLQDCAIRFLCVLSLDRFGDYVSDQVVAPVRETCAQALGAAFKYMHPSLVHETLKILLQMQSRPEWEIRHGSLLGIKYLVAVRKDMLNGLLDSVLPACKAGLEDPDDDVRAVAADALIPAAASIVSLNGQMLHSIVMLLWDILLDLDDLSPSTSSVMNLLAEIYSCEEMIPKMLGSLTVKEKQEFDLNEVVLGDDQGYEIKSEENPYMLSTLAPRLWPFMRHSITSVRHSAIRTLERLLEAGCQRSSEFATSSFWPSFILEDSLRIVYQNLLLEANDDILGCSERVWRLLLQCPEGDLEMAARLYFTSWIELATTPYGSPLDASKMFWPVALPRRSHFRAAAKMRAIKLENECSINFGFDSSKGSTLHERNEVVSANHVKIIVGADNEKSVTHTRAATAVALGILASKLPHKSLQFVVDPVLKELTSLSGVQRQVASLILVSWFKELQSNGMDEIVSDYVGPLRKWLLDLLSCADPSFPTKDSILPYAELSRTYAKMRCEASLLFSAVASSGIFKNVLSTMKLDLDTINVDDAISFGSKVSLPGNYSTMEESVERHILDDVESSRQRLLSTSGYLKCVQNNLHITVSSLVAAAVVWMSELPAKLNPVILPLMASIKREQEEILQQKAAEALAELISRCIARRPGPNDKLIKNLCNLICMDPCETPQAAVINSIEIIEDQDLLSFVSSAGSQKNKVHLPAGGEDRSRVEGFISRRGSELALKHLCQKFGVNIFDKLPRLWECLTEVLKPEIPEGVIPPDNHQYAVENVKDPQTLINNIQVIRSIAPVLDETLKPKILTLLPCIFKCVCHYHVAVRLAASRCITSMARSMKESVMAAVIEKAIPMLGDRSSVHARQGASMLLRLLVQGLGVELVPYSPLLVVPLLRCMSDCDTSVRQSVTHSFAALVPLLPLARGLPPPSGLSEVVTQNTEDSQFLEQLLDNSHIDDYKLSTELKVALRRYQQEGINWLSFLRRFKLHGILCDDMGLGKTLQASAIVASDIAEHRASNEGKDLLSLIICPSTLVAHWAYEIEKYIDSSVMKPLQYAGSAQERTYLRSQFEMCNIVITSYDVVRKDIDFISQIVWNYCILDEGHIIKNSKSKITGAVKQLKAEHRLILSGTPIQNNILELWSLFDFLMPGFLGTERQFQATFGKPLSASKDAKCTVKEAEAGALAMEALHKQVMPFLLRRTKAEVLSDLPEKIIQDRYCDLSPVQLKLYEQFSSSDVKKDISTLVKVNKSQETVGGSSASPKASSHVFQALQYLLKLCSHPLLVVGEKLSDSLKILLSELIPGCADIIPDLHKLHHSPKLVALHEILEECGIGSDASSSDSAVGGGQHRVLIFAQHKAFLDIIERDLFQTHMKSVTYLRLDGSVEPDKRFDIVKAFNSDPTIDVLLLTTHVGGLGLNLTSADTLVFMEHDWNPMRDHQAMDRAHRLGQRKVVNVHRLIMRGTLEEKVMSLQKFKVSIANAVINADNASLKTMNTDQLLDLFASAQTGNKGATPSKNSEGNTDGELKSVGVGKGLKAVLGGLGELWDQSQYADEYDLNQFLAKLNG
ncbi:Tata-binding protein-associated factor btaf1 [Thalictrum thalictroides]|uniref:Tata-binding protein-associated factor btaf1 n=1 Tax=Thalictrum thalictroides TaxID=46969 RepID=A0A7J6X2G6_THATH|nr:Tata-binding protein-associated factor btaf1 [Thalictrum thalictroides]